MVRAQLEFQQDEDYGVALKPMAWAKRIEDPGDQTVSLSTAAVLIGNHNCRESALISGIEQAKMFDELDPLKLVVESIRHARKTVPKAAQTWQGPASPQHACPTKGRYLD